MKRKQNLDNSDGEKSPISKKPKRELFTAADFKRSLDDSSTIYAGLENFIKTVKLNVDEKDNDIVSDYCKSTSDCEEILGLLGAEKIKVQETFLILESIRLILSRILTDLNQYNIIGQSVVKKLIANHMNVILKQTSMANKSGHIKSGLRLLTLLISGGASKGCSNKWGWICKEVTSKIDFNHNNWLSLLNRKDAQDPEDVKLCLMDLICTMLSTRIIPVVKAVVEAKHFVSALFENLYGDNCLVICKFLDTVLNHVVNNPTITKTFKVKLFNDRTLKSIGMLYRWAGPKGWQEMIGSKKEKQKIKKLMEDNLLPFDWENISEEQEVVRTHVHSLLVSLLSSYKFGIIFKDRSAPIISGQNPNYNLTTFLNNLPPSFYIDPLPRSLALQIFKSCPDQLHFFLGLPSFAGVLTPRVSKNWFTCSEFVTEVFRDQKYGPQSFSLFLLSGDPVRMGENYVQHVLPSKDIWTNFMIGLMGDYHKQIVMRCLNFISVNVQRLHDCMIFMDRERSDKGDLFVNNSQLFADFESSFRNGLKKNVPSFIQLVDCLERFIRKMMQSKEELVADSNNADDSLKKKEEAVQAVLEKLPEISLTTAACEFLRLLCTLRSLLTVHHARKLISTIKLVLKSNLDSSHMEESCAEESKGSKSSKSKKLKQKSKAVVACDDNILTTPTNLKDCKTMLLHFWKVVMVKNIRMKYFVEADDDGDNNVMIITATLRCLHHKISDGDDDDSLTNALLSDTISQVLLQSGYFTNSSEVKCWLRSLTQLSGSNEMRIQFFLATLKSLVDSSSSVNSDPHMSLFLQTVLKNCEEGCIGDYVDAVLSDVVTTLDNPIEFCGRLKDHKQIKRLPKFWSTITVLRLEIWMLYYGIKLMNWQTTNKQMKQKSTNEENDFKTDLKLSGKVNVLEAQNFQHQLRMLSFSAAIEAFKSKGYSNNKLKFLLDKLTTGVKELLKICRQIKLNKRTRNKDVTTTEVKDNEEDFDNDGDAVTDDDKHNQIGLDGHDKQEELTVSIYKETCTYLFSGSFLRTFFLNDSTSSTCVVLVAKWFADMAEKFCECEDELMLKEVFDVPIKTFNEFLANLLKKDGKNVSLALQVQLMRLVKYFSSNLLLSVVEMFCQKFIFSKLNEADDDNDDDVEESEEDVLMVLGRKLLAGEDILRNEDLLKRIVTILKQRIIEKNSSNVKTMLSFIVDSIGKHPATIIEVLMLNKKKKTFFFNQILSSADSEKLSFVKNLMEMLPIACRSPLTQYVTEWLENNKSLWTSKKDWSMYAGVLVELLKSPGASADVSKTINHFLWSQMVDLICCHGDGHQQQPEEKERSQNDPKSTKELMIFLMKSLNSYLNQSSKEEGASNDDEVLQELSKQWSQFVKMGLKHHMENENFIELLSSIIRHFVVDGKQHVAGMETLHSSIPDIFNMVVGHSTFMGIAMKDSNSPGKESIFKLLHTLTAKEPKKCCKPNLVPLLFGAYSASMSTTDQCILSMLHMSEQTGCDLLQFKPYYWGQKAVDYQASKKVLFMNVILNHGLNEFLDQLDPKLMLDTAVNFPFSCKLDFSSYNPYLSEDPTTDGTVQSYTLYNPSFVLHAIYHLLMTTSEVDCRKFIYKNCLGLVVASLTSHERPIRNLGGCILTAFRCQLDDSKFIDRDQVSCLLDALKNGIDESEMKLPSVVSVFIIRALNVLLKPDDHMYTLVNQFFLLKPALNIRDVPEFYKLFFSSTMEHKKERTWLLDMLTEGIRETKDYHICEKRKVFKSLMCFYMSPFCDQPSKIQVLNIFLKICSCSRSAVWNLIKRHGLLSWITSAFFVFSGNLSKKSASSVVPSSSQISTSSPSSLQAIMGKLVHLLSMCWQGILSSKSQPQSFKKVHETSEETKEACNMEEEIQDDAELLPATEERLLPPTVLAEMLLTVEQLLQSSLCFSPSLRKTLKELSCSVKQEAMKTSVVFKSKGFIFPIPVGLFQG